MMDAPQSAAPEGQHPPDGLALDHHTLALELGLGLMVGLGFGLGLGLGLELCFNQRKSLEEAHALIPYQMGTGGHTI